MRHVVLGLLLVLPLAGCEKITAYEPPPEKRQADIDKEALEQAKALSAKGDVAGAHARLGAVLLDSPLRRQPDFVKIENDWARAQIDKGKAEKNAKAKGELFEEVAKNTAVSPELRAEATNLAVEANPQPSIGTGADFQEADAVLKEAQSLLEDPKKQNPKAAVKLVLDRVIAGKATAREVDWLLTVCIGSKDQECMAELDKRGLVPPAVRLAAAGPSGAKPAGPAPKPKPR